MHLDIDWVRAQFPAFSEPSLEGQAFFENAGGSYTCAPVIDRLTRFYRERKVQPYAPYDASRLSDFLQACDLVKYAALRPRGEDADQALGTARVFIDATAAATQRSAFSGGAREAEGGQAA